MIEKLVPVLVVDAIEPSLPLWVDQLGYTKTTEVPHEGRLGFVILTGAAGEVMMQTKASLAADLPALAARSPSVVLYADVPSLEAALRAVAGAEVLVPPRTTFYGAREAAIVDPQGHLVILAEPARQG